MSVLWEIVLHDLTGFQRDFLHAIAGETEPHGLAIKEELEELEDRIEELTEFESGTSFHTRAGGEP